MGTCRLGVTGHRTFDDVLGTQQLVDVAVDDAVAAAVTDGGDESTGEPTTVEFWTSLAEGADRLVAERVFAAHPSAQLHVVLPLEPDDYARDFATQESVASFRKLLQRAASVRVTGPDIGGTRESAYERAGVAVVEAVDTLIAVWDGKPARGRGGTAQMIELAKSLGKSMAVIPVARGSEPS